jgi:hypothetical protein
MEEKLDQILIELSEMRKENSHSSIRIMKIERALKGDPEYRTKGLIDKVEEQGKILDQHTIKHNDFEMQKKKAAGFLAAFSIFMSLIIWGIKEAWNYFSKHNL